LRLRIGILVAVQLILSPVVALAEPRAYLITESGYFKREILVIDGKRFRVQNPIMDTYNIDDFKGLQKKYPAAYSSLENHNDYAIAGARGFAFGAGVAVAAAITDYGKQHPVVPIALLLAGFAYGFNARHMAKHNLHKAINQINGVRDYGFSPKFDFIFASNNSLGFALRF
jgi:hypothetical protein